MIDAEHALAGHSETDMAALGRKLIVAKRAAWANQARFNSAQDGIEAYELSPAQRLDAEIKLPERKQSLTAPKK